MKLHMFSLIMCTLEPIANLLDFSYTYTESDYLSWRLESNMGYTNAHNPSSQCL